MKDKPNRDDQIDDWVDRVISAVMRRAGKGLADAEQQAGVAAGYLRKARGGPRNIMLAKLLRICREAELEPGAVFAEVFPNRLAGVGLAGKRDIPIVRRTRDCFSRPSGESVEPVSPEWLLSLDELRYDHPERVLTITENAVDFLPPSSLLQNLGIWASACRVLARHEEGHAALVAAIELAQECAEETVLADLLRRMSFMRGSMSGNWLESLLFSEQALAIYTRLEFAPRMGQVLADQGVILGYLRRFEASRRAFDASLRRLPKDDRRHRFASLYGIANLSQLQGAPRKALTEANVAEQVASAAFEKGKLAWLRARAFVDLQLWDDCLSAFEAVCELLSDIAPIDAALSICDHVRALLAVGRVEEARARSGVMRSLLEPLRSNPMASHAIRDLLCSEQEGQALTVALINSTTTRLSKSRRAPARRP